MSKDWVFKRHMRIKKENIEKFPKKPRKPPIGEKKEFDEKEIGSVLISQLDKAISYCRRPEKILADEEYFFIIRTKKQIHFEESLLDRFGLKFCLQKDDYSAIVTLKPQMLENFRKILDEYTKTKKLRSYINDISSISSIDFNRISPDLMNWLGTSKEEMFLELEFIPNLGRGNLS